MSYGTNVASILANLFFFFVIASIVYRLTYFPGNHHGCNMNCFVVVLPVCFSSSVAAACCTVDLNHVFLLCKLLRFGNCDETPNNVHALRSVCILFGDNFITYSLSSALTQGKPESLGVFKLKKLYRCIWRG